MHGSYADYREGGSRGRREYVHRHTWHHMTASSTPAAACACWHVQSSSSRISCRTPHTRTTTSICSVSPSPSLPSHRPTAQLMRQSASTASQTGLRDAAWRERSRALLLACKVAEPLPPAEEPPSAPAMSPTHASGAIAYLQVTSGSMLASREGGEQPDEQMETSLRQLESQHVHSKPCTARAEQVLHSKPCTASPVQHERSKSCYSSQRI